jgi:hypothetical protein
MNQINVKHITNLNSESLRGLDFYKQELGFLQERLDEIAADNTGKEVAEKIEYFQNQLIIHRRAVDELRHLIKGNNKSIERQLAETDAFVSEYTAVEHQKLNDQYLTEEKLFSEMRHDFNRFAAEWM